ncbi:hypothetical protein [Streptomyces puniciscabiei]|uniref:hypothetical protein n=1 Tax=Streptomyces puniciscabiei TaxID=164348 RepID=UPI003316982E
MACLSDGNREEVDSDQGRVRVAGEPQAGTAAAAAQVGQELARVQVELLGDVVKQVGAEEREQVQIRREVRVDQARDRAEGTVTGLSFAAEETVEL